MSRNFAATFFIWTNCSPCPRTWAATGDLAWENRYQQHVATLDHAIQEAATLIPEAIARQFMAQTDDANKKLVDMELRSFELVREQRRKRKRWTCYKVNNTWRKRRCT